MPRRKNSSARELEKFDAAMLLRPPTIVWVLDKRRRVMVAASVDDPHVELSHHRNAGKQVCTSGHEFDEVNTISRPDGSRDCRACKRRRDRESTERRKLREAAA